MEYLKTLIYKFDFGRFMLPTIGINTIIDVIIVTYLTYHIILWIKETRAFSLLKGIAVIVLVSAFAFLFNLYTLQWILKGTYSVGVTALIVIFQPELRRALEKIGKGRIGQAFSIGFGEEKTTISEFSKGEIYRTCLHLARGKVGGLILIEQKTPLGEFSATGIPLDAKISSELLLNIFVDKSPLHDGAVMIKNNRIIAASAIFPLTEKELSSELGTRHRAALGIAEVSDAYIIVISEESGKISLAHDGALELDISHERLSEVLNSIYIKKTAEKKKRHSIFPLFNRQEEDKNEKKH